MADKLLSEYLYGDLLSPASGYHTDFAMGMTYSLSFEALLTAYLAFGMLGEMDDNILHSPHFLLEAITKSSDKVVVFCNKGGIAVPPTIRKVYSLMEDSIFEVFDKNNHKANFHPKLWLIREINKDDDRDVRLKLIVSSRNLAFSDSIDCVVCLTGKVSRKTSNNEKHQPLVSFIKSVVKESNIGEEQKKAVLKLAADVAKVDFFETDGPFEDYDFYPYLFDYDFGLPPLENYLVGNESIIVSPFIDRSLLSKLNPSDRSSRTLITRKEYVDSKIFKMFCDKVGIFVTLDDLASRGMDLHAKMYYVWKDRHNQYLFLGSANATTSAFARNGEFLLGLKYKYGNKRSAQFLNEFYEEGNPESKFRPMTEPLETGADTGKWDSAETAMKELMCAEDLKARISRHRDGTFTATLTSKIRNLTNDVFIAPLQKRNLMQRWTGRAVFNDLNLDELSEFYIIRAVTVDDIRQEKLVHEQIIKVTTQGMPADRNNEIYKGIIKRPEDFFKVLELMLTDTPLQYISNEILFKYDGGGEAGEEGIRFPDLYEKMLRIAATNPGQFKELERLIEKLGRNVVPPAFLDIYRHFISANKTSKTSNKSSKTSSNRMVR